MKNREALLNRAFLALVLGGAVASLLLIFKVPSGLPSVRSEIIEGVLFTLIIVCFGCSIVLGLVSAVVFRKLKYIGYSLISLALGWALLLGAMLSGMGYL